MPVIAHRISSYEDDRSVNVDLVARQPCFNNMFRRGNGHFKKPCFVTIRRTALDSPIHHFLIYAEQCPRGPRVDERGKWIGSLIFLRVSVRAGDMNPSVANIHGADRVYVYWMELEWVSLHPSCIVAP